MANLFLLFSTVPVVFFMATNTEKKKKSVSLRLDENLLREIELCIFGIIPVIY